ncbi:hypothetical protein GCM10027037_21650 [Mucilaginibacter koreensis]
MKQQEVLKKIGGIISELSEQYQYMQAEPEHLNQLELELFVANAHFLADHAEILRKICNAAPPVKELPPAPELPVITPVITEEPAAPVMQWEHVQTITEGPQDAPEAALPEPEEAPVEVTAPEPKEINLPEPAPVEPEPIEVELIGPGEVEAGPIEPEQIEPEPKPVQNTEPAPPVVAEVNEPAPVPSIDLGGQTDTYNYVRQTPEPATESTFSISSGRTAEEPAAPVAGISGLGNAEPAEPLKPEVTADAASAEPTEVQPEVPLTLNQRLSAQRNGGQPVTSSAAPAGKPVSDLASAVNLNDKLLFVKDLFNGYNLAYKEAIDRLNRCKTFEEADRLLKTDYITKNNWAGKTTTADKFYALLHRRFDQ